MFWIVIAIVIAAIIIANAVKKSSWEANATPEQKTAKYNAQVQAMKIQKARQLCLAIQELCKRGKSNKQIAGNSKVQKFAIASGIDISSEDDVRNIKRDVGFLVTIGCLDKFKAMVASGDTDEKIAKKLGRGYEGYLMYRCYDAEDIKFMRESILGHSSTNIDNQPKQVQSNWGAFNDELDNKG